MMRLLMSYHFYRDADMDRALAGFQQPLDLFADSGAYSAYSQGSPIHVDDYCNWLEREAWRFSCYVNLDVIGDVEGTWRNQQRMEERGLNPVPVFHGGEPWEYLERYCESHRYVALGGMVASNKPAAMRWLIQCFKIAAKNDVRIHGFGQTRLQILRSFPWYSVDSSSWASAHRFGGLMLWDDWSAKFVKIDLHKHEQAYRHAALIREHGGDPAEVAHPQAALVQRGDPDIEYWRDVRSRIITMNARAWMRYERWLQRHHGSVEAPEGFPTKLYVGHLDEPVVHEPDGGPKVYLVIPNDAVHDNGDTRPLKDMADAGPKVYLALVGGPKIYLASSGGDGGKLSDISGEVTEEDA